MTRRTLDIIKLHPELHLYPLQSTAVLDVTVPASVLLLGFPESLCPALTSDAKQATSGEDMDICGTKIIKNRIN